MSKDSLLGRVTEKEWIKWTAPKSELTNKGGILETIMGQYFRVWLQDEKLLDFEKQPTKDEVNIYANSMQRTIATANYFKTGFYPTFDIPVYHRFDSSKMDPLFFPRLTKVNSKFIEQASSEINGLENHENIYEHTKSLKPSFDTIENVIDLKNSKAYKENELTSLNDYDTKVKYELCKEPSMTGSLRTATVISDALVLQYFEQPDDNKAGFGKKLSSEEWEKISKVKDVYGDVLFTPYVVAVNVAHPLLTYIYDELNSKHRKFTYLVGHDSNLGSVTAALKIKEYSLPNTIEKKTPIGAKLVFEKWENKESKKTYVNINMIYQSTEQLRYNEMLSLENPPMKVPILFEGLEVNKDGLYLLDDVNKRFEEAIRAYDSI